MPYPDAYKVGQVSYHKCVGSHFYGLGHSSRENEAAFIKGYRDARWEALSKLWSDLIC